MHASVQLLLTLKINTLMPFLRIEERVTDELMILNRSSLLRSVHPDVLSDVAGARRGELEGLRGTVELRT